MSLVLLAEDNDDVREALSAVLSARGYDVVPAENGKVALDLLLEGVRPCVILCDLMMPEMDGAEFWGHQRRDPALRGIPTVIYSGHPDAKEKVRSAGIEAFLRKPLDIEELVAIADRHCR